MEPNMRLFLCPRESTVAASAGPAGCSRGPVRAPLLDTRPVCWPERPPPAPLTSEQSSSGRSGRAGLMQLSDRWPPSLSREDEMLEERNQRGFCPNQRRLQIPLASGWKPRDTGPGTCDLLFAQLPPSGGGCARQGCAVVSVTPAPNRGRRTHRHACGPREGRRAWPP